MNFWEYVIENQEELLTLTLEHLLLVLVSLGIATVLSVGIGLATYRSSFAEKVAISTTSVLFTIPSLALFGLLIPFFGLGTAPALVALVIYAMLPILRNTYSGLQAVDPAVLDAARGIGMGRALILLRVRLPLAGPVILVGIRIATQMGMGIATVAAYAGGPGLGNEIFSGLARFGSINSVNEVLVGLVGVVVLTLVADAVFIFANRFLIPRSIHV